MQPPERQRRGDDVGERGALQPAAARPAAHADAADGRRRPVRQLHAAAQHSSASAHAGPTGQSVSRSGLELEVMHLERRSESVNVPTRDKMPSWIV